MRRLVPVLLVAALSGCASGAASGPASSAAHPKPAPERAQGAESPEPAQPTDASAAAAPGGEVAATSAPPALPAEPAPLPDTVDGPDIPRPALLLVLEQGVGRFLQKVSIEPHLERGRFVGWRILELFDHEPELSRGVLLPGDTLVRVNGQSVERPEQFKNVWDSLATESQLVLQVIRAGKLSEVRHRIVQSSTSEARGARAKGRSAAAVPRAITRPAASPVSPVR